MPAFIPVQPRFAQLPERLAAFVAALTDEELARLYKSSGRVWLDSGDLKLRLSYGIPHHHAAHDLMREKPSVGNWVSVDLYINTHADHPFEGGVPLDWAPDADWMRGMLAGDDDLLWSLQYEVRDAESRLVSESLPTGNLK